MVAAVIPAAGSSRRMGRPKPLLPYRGSTLLGSVTSALRAGGASRLVVVVRPDDRELRRHAADLGASVAVNPHPERGMLTSILAGLGALGGAAALASEGDALLVCPADHPAVPAEVVRRLLARLERGAALAVPVHRGRRGHPLAIEARLLAEVAALDPAVGLRQLLERHAGELEEVECDDPGVLLDVDRPEDYERLLAGG